MFKKFLNDLAIVLGVTFAAVLAGTLTIIILSFL